MTLLISALTFLQVFFGVALFAARLPRRSHFGARLALSAAVLFVTCGATVQAAQALAVSQGSALSEIFCWAVVLCACMLAILLCFSVGPWVALFCCTAGYSVQNLWAGLEGFFRMAVTNLGFYVYDNPDQIMPSTIIFFIVTYGLCAWFFARKITQSGLQYMETPWMAWVAAFVMVFEVGLFSVERQMAMGGLNAYQQIYFGLAHIFACVTVFFMQFHLLLGQQQAMEAAATQQARALERRQYELSAANVDELMRRSHDLKHQVRAAAITPEAAQKALAAAQERDAFFATGNRGLDVILTEKALAFRQQGISLSVIADGAALTQLSEADIYSLFGNGLDNAAEAISKLPQDADHSVVVDVRRKGAMTLIHVSNAYAAAPEFTDGVPRTTKSDPGHGWGTKSMTEVVRRAGGTITFSAREGRFSVNILLPAGAAPAGAASQK